MILTTAYFPSISYIGHIAKSDGPVLIEACENFQKQSYRNRFRILSDKGIQILSIPVHAGNNTPIKDIQIDYVLPWQREHLRAIKTCYGSAPFFPYVIDRIEDLFTINEKWLLDYNMVILERLLKILNISCKIGYTKTFTPLVNGDPRLITSRKYTNSEQKPYYQVFMDRQPFVADLSIIDYMMCEGFKVL